MFYTGYDVDQPAEVGKFNLQHASSYGMLPMMTWRERRMDIFQRFCLHYGEARMPSRTYAYSKRSDNSLIEVHKIFSYYSSSFQFLSAFRRDNIMKIK